MLDRSTRKRAVREGAMYARADDDNDDDDDDNDDDDDDDDI